MMRNVALFAVLAGAVFGQPSWLAFAAVFTTVQTVFMAFVRDFTGFH